MAFNICVNLYVKEVEKEVDFFSIGTNDLSQYTLAIDRQNPKLDTFFDAHHPAILRLLQATAETGEELHILADSQYAINVVSKWRLGWKKRGWVKSDKKPALNADLWEQMLAQVARHDVRYHWVKGHASNEKNNRCDELAVMESRKFKK